MEVNLSGGNFRVILDTLQLSVKQFEESEKSLGFERC